jgi:hypothetical protein
MSATNFVTLRLLVGEAQDLLSALPAAQDWNARAVAALTAAAEAGTPAAQWRAMGEPDPHAGRYDCERAALCMGDLTDDELANEAFMHYDVRPPTQALLAGTAHAPIAWMTAVKDRIRWLSRALEWEIAGRAAGSTEPISVSAPMSYGDGFAAGKNAAQEEHDSAAAEPNPEQQALMTRLHKFLDVAAGEGLELDGVDAADLYCDIFDTGIEVEQRTAAAALPALAYAPTGFAAFKNFHRSLCTRFGYTHDHAFWWRDLVSLEEWIANRPLLAQLTPSQVDDIVTAGSFRNAAGGIYETSIYSFARDCIDAARPVGISAAARDVLAERARCISAEGWTPEHDDEHDAGELAAAAAAYAIAAADALHPLSQGDGGFADEPPVMWPWDREWWKPGPPRRMLEKAGQLALAQMECIDRAAAREAQP